MAYVDPRGRVGVDVAPFRKLFLQIVAHCGGSYAAGKLCGFTNEKTSWKVLNVDRIEHTTARKILAAWKQLKASGVKFEAKEAA